VRSSVSSIEEIKGAIYRNRDSSLELLKTIVNIDSWTHYKEGVDEVGSIIAGKLRELGFNIEFIREEQFGNHVRGCRNMGSRPRILLVGHMDTVYPVGTARKRPFTIKNGRAFGPGVLDMKGGIIVMISALEALKDIGSDVYSKASLCVFLNSDEEILSPTSSNVMDEDARKSDLAVVFEPSRPNGGYVRRRWAVARIRIYTHGVASHAGWVATDRGVSAVHELVLKLGAIIRKISGLESIMFNIGVIRGGEAFNVVAPNAEAEISVRAPSMENLTTAVDLIREEVLAQVYLEGAKSNIEILSLWPPLIDNERNLKAFSYFQEAARELGQELILEDTGGGSDGNHLAQYVAVVDGAGAYGRYPHSPDEYIEVDKTFERAVIAARALEVFYRGYKQPREDIRGV